MKTDGLQEAILKNPELSENVDRITKMKRVIKAVSNKVTNKRQYTEPYNETENIFSIHSCLSGGLCPPANLWFPFMPSSLDRRFVLLTLTKP